MSVVSVYEWAIPVGFAGDSGEAQAKLLPFVGKKGVDQQFSCVAREGLPSNLGEQSRRALDIAGLWGRVVQLQLGSQVLYAYQACVCDVARKELVGPYHWFVVADLLAKNPVPLIKDEDWVERMVLQTGNSYGEVDSELFMELRFGGEIAEAREILADYKRGDVRIDEALEVFQGDVFHMAEVKADHGDIAMTIEGDDPSVEGIRLTMGDGRVLLVTDEGVLRPRYVDVQTVGGEGSSFMELPGYEH